MRLCLQAGILDVDQVAERLSVKQLDEWLAFESYIEPFEDRRMDRRIGLLACAVGAVALRENSHLRLEMFDLSGAEARDDEEEDAESPSENHDWRLMKARVMHIEQMHDSQVVAQTST